ncbi:N-acetyltransferase family protein [Amaricoccus sp. W119]|uniref:GNAT family N-acetyltransferase n=1 Tax=Amaricoccus sp. W119 TaxID=3391833 RepID=UPI0039A45171
MKIRDAADEDLEEVTAIYNDAVEQTTAIWNEVRIGVDNRRAWLADRRRAGYPVLVAVSDDGDILGYASFGDWRAWDGYRHTVEHSVYVRNDQRGAGIGRALMEALIGRARELGKHVMVAGIEAGNTGSIRLHEKLGFARVGHLTEVGTKFGRWLDLTFLQLTLDGRTVPDPVPDPASDPAGEP